MHPLPSLFLLGVVAAAAVAQAPTAPVTVAGASASIVAGALGTSHDGDDVVGIGPRYLLRARADAVVFTPVLGSSAERSLPLGLRFVAARRGEQVVATLEPRRSDSPRDVVFDRGAVRERYELRADGVEQTFTFATAPAGEGDLVVRLAVDAVVAGQVGAAGGIDFTERGAGVHYGALVGVDAGGRTAAGRVTLCEGGLELTLPAAFVATATFPLTFDPLLGTSGLLNSTADDGQPAVGVSANPARWLVVWRRTVALGEGQLVAQLVDNNLAVGTPSLLDATPGTDVAAPQVVTVGGTGDFVVLWRRGVGLFGPPTALVGRVVPANGGGIGLMTSFSSSSAPIFAFAAGNPAGASTTLPLVFIGSSELVGSIGLQVTGTTLLLTSQTFVHGGSLGNERHVALTSSGGGGRWVVVWTSDPASGLNLRARAIDASGAPLGPATTLGAAVSLRTQPSVDGDGSQFVVTWLENGALQAQGGTLQGAPGSLVPVLQGAPAAVPSGAGAVVRNGDLVFTGTDYVAAWADGANPFATDAHAVVLRGDPLGFADVLPLVGPPRAGGYSRRGAPRLAARGPLLPGDVTVLAVWEEGQGSLPFERDVVGQFLQTMGAGGPVTTLAPACGAGGTAGAAGPCAIGNANFAFTLAGADPTTPLTLLSLALTPSIVPCGTCSLLPGLVLEAHPLTAGAATRPLPIPLDVGLLGLAIQAQWLPMFGAPGPCPLFPFVSASSIVQVTVGS